MRRCLVIFAFLLGVASLPASANYAINGRCFVTASEALDSFSANYPQVVVTSGSPIWWSLSSASITGQNLTVVLRKTNTNQASITVPIANCTAPTIAPFDVTQALAAFSFFFSAVILIFVVSHGGGAILTAIKKGGTRLLG